MNLSRPYSSVVPTLDGDVLAVLARTVGGLTGREVARLAARGSQRGTLRALDRLVDQGVVAREEAGSSFQYTLNRDHLAAPAVEALTSIRSALWERLQAAFAVWDPPLVHASVFGSTARGDGDAASDVDVLLVHSDALDPEDADWREQVAELADQILRWTGNSASIAELAVADLPALASKRPELAENLRTDAIVLAGPAVTTLMEDL